MVAAVVQRGRGKPLPDLPVEKVREKLERFPDMKKAALALATAATVGFTALAAPSPAEARWRGGFGPGLASGRIGAAGIGGRASSAYAYGPCYGYYDDDYYGYAPRYYGGCYGGSPAYY